MENSDRKNVFSIPYPYEVVKEALKREGLTWHSLWIHVPLFLSLCVCVVYLCVEGN